MILGAYGMQRRLCIGTMYGDKLVPGAGVVAGCSLAMSVIKAYYGEAPDALQARWKRKAGERGCGFELQVYIDDITATLRRASGEVPTILPDLEKDLHQTMQEQIGGKVAVDKSNMIASDGPTWRKANAAR